MTRTSCISHPSGSRFIKIHDWQLMLCEGNTVAAALLSFFEYWHNVKLAMQPKNFCSNDIAEGHGDKRSQDETTLQFHSEKELVDGIQQIGKRDSIRKAISWLENKQFISVQKNPNKRYAFDKTRYFQFYPEPINEWLSSNLLPISENRQRSLVNELPQSENTSAITKITSEITSENTLPPTPQGERESERKFGFEIQENPEPISKHSTSLDKKSGITQLTSNTVVEAIIPAPAEIAIKYDPALGIRPPRQKPKFRYPDGPWLTQAGQINEDFIRDRAALWRTGDTTASKGFGAMAIEDVIGLVCGHYQRTENHAKLETDWTAYVAKNQRYVANVQMRVAAGIEIQPDEQNKILQKVPASISEKIEPAYGNAMTERQLLGGSFPPKAAAPLIKSEPPQLESVATVPDEIWDTIAATTEEEQSQFIGIPMPEGAENVAAYTNTAKSEDSDFFRALHEKHLACSVQPASPTISSLEELKTRIGTLNSNKAMPSVSADARARMRDEERLERKLTHWTALLQTGIPSVIADVHRQAAAQGYEIVDGEISEVDF